MPNRNKKRFFLLVLSTVVTLFVFWWIQPERRLDIDQDAFQVEDLSAISRVSLVSANGEVNLTFDGGTWRVNAQHKADADLIRVLFATLQQATPKRAVTGTRQDSLFRQLTSSGVKVSLYAGEAVEKTFFAGGNQSKTQAFFADPKSGEVYVVTIPGYRVYVSGILELPEEGWRDKFVFGFNWRNFKSLEAKFPAHPDENFVVSMSRDHFGIEGMPEADTALLNTFLDDVSLLTVDAYIPEPGLMDSLLQTPSRMEISIADVANRTYELRIFDAGAGSRVLGVIQGSQAAQFDVRKIDLLLRPKSFFRKK